MILFKKNAFGYIIQNTVPEEPNLPRLCTRVCKLLIPQQYGKMFE